MFKMFIGRDFFVRSIKANENKNHKYLFSLNFSHKKIPFSSIHVSNFPSNTLLFQTF